ncbi:hypothetical protein LEP1GSC065_3277 [Leptospira kirschneri serovar Sokoine str. RM1]|nr:hypothetical protein LEP1GSC065_3277 [Leptospira kirschneri serovar Sokoine str. RM1]
MACSFSPFKEEKELYGKITDLIEFIKFQSTLLLKKRKNKITIR